MGRKYNFHIYNSHYRILTRTPPFQLRLRVTQRTNPLQNYLSLLKKNDKMSFFINKKEIPNGKRQLLL